MILFTQYEKEELESAYLGIAFNDAEQAQHLCVRMFERLRELGEVDNKDYDDIRKEAERLIDKMRDI